MRLRFHVLGGGANLVDAQRTHQPIGFALVIAPHMLAPDQRNGLAETRPMQPDERRPMPVLLIRHVVENLGGLRKTIPQAIRIRTIDPPVILL